jgi:hypothetical protein
VILTRVTNEGSSVVKCCLLLLKDAGEQVLVYVGMLEKALWKCTSRARDDNSINSLQLDHRAQNDIGKRGFAQLYTIQARLGEGRLFDSWTTLADTQIVSDSNRLDEQRRIYKNLFNRIYYTTAAVYTGNKKTYQHARYLQKRDITACSFYKEDPETIEKAEWKTTMRVLRETPTH